MPKPLFPALANLPSAASDAALAASFDGHGFNVIGRLSKPDLLVFEFFRQDGSSQRYAAPELRRMTWWYWLEEDDALRLEANLFDDDDLYSRKVHYVARCDMDAGGLLIRNSRLSAYFSGDSAMAEANREYERVKAEWPDAGLFSADSIEDAECLLAAVDPHEVSRQKTRARMAIARAKRFASLLS